MKKMKYLPILLVVVFVITMSSCELLMSLLGLTTEGVTVEERIKAFQDSLNSADWTAIPTTHFHEDMANRSQLFQSTAFTTGPLKQDWADFTFGTPTITDDGDDKIAACSFANSVPATGTIVFTMRLDGSDWMILKFVLTVPVGGTEYTIERFDVRTE